MMEHREIVIAVLVALTVFAAGGLGYESGWMNGWKAGNAHSRETMERLEKIRKALRRDKE